MKRNQLITLVVIIAFVGLLVVINRMEPSRVSEEQAAESAEAEALIEEAEEAEAEAASQAAEAAEQAFEEAEAETQEESTESDSAPAMNDYQVEFITSEGTFVIEVHPEWAPIGAQRFREAVEAGVYDQARFFRVIPGFVVQFGIPGDPEMAEEWYDRTIQDEPVKASNTRGTVTFAKTARPNSRTTQVFINLDDKNARLDQMGFAPFGEVVKGLDVVDRMNAEYLQQPDQEQIRKLGNAYLKEYFPNLDYVEEANILGEVAAEPGESGAEEAGASPEE